MSWEKTLRVLGSVPLHSYPIPCSSLSFNSLYLSSSIDSFPERLAVPGIQSSSLVLVWFSVRSMLRTFCRPITIYQDQLMLELGNFTYTHRLFSWRNVSSLVKHSSIQSIQLTFDLSAKVRNVLVFFFFSDDLDPHNPLSDLDWSVYHQIVERCSNVKLSYVHKYVIVVLTDIKKLLCEILIYLWWLGALLKN